MGKPPPISGTEHDVPQRLGMQLGTTKTSLHALVAPTLLMWLMLSSTGVACCTQSLVDLTGLFRIWNPRYNTWSVFGQDHLAKVRSMICGCT